LSSDSSGDVVIIDDFNSEIISSIFGWASAFGSTLGFNDVKNLDIETVDVLDFAVAGELIEIVQPNSVDREYCRSFLNTCLYKFEFDLFQQATKTKKINIFELVKAADFWDMPRLTSSLALYIVHEMVECQSDNDQIYSTLFKSKLFFPIEFAQRVLYLLLLKRHAGSNAFFNLWTNKNSVYEQRIIDFDDFIFLYSIENEFIKFEPQNEQLMTSMSYRGAGFNLKILQKLKCLMLFYLDKEDLNESIVAGGIFWDYKIDSPFANRFPLLFNIYKAKQDVDIFILDNEEHLKYNSYIFKMTYLFNKKIEANTLFVASKNLYVNQDDTDYEIYSFKKLCIYCFDVLLVHLNESKKEAIFPEEFKGVYKNHIKI
jgi:hypothetical protein